MGNGNNNGDRNMDNKTQTIAGHTFTLQAGETYLASRNGDQRNRGPENFIVTISASNTINPYEVAKTSPLTYDNANTLINDFNNGETSWEGRVW
jgi:hypothetical protein